MPFIDKSTLTYPATNSFPVRKWLDTRAPLSSDFKAFQLFDLWINETTGLAYIMVGRTATDGTWLTMATSGTGILSITGDTGGAVPADMNDNINLLSGSNLTVTGDSGTNTLTITLDDTIASSYPTDSGTATPSSGVLNILGTGGTTTSGSGNTVTVTSGPSVPTSFVTDAGTATPVANSLNILGGTGVDTVGAGDTVTINAAASVPTMFTADSGTATPAANNINILGTGSATTTASGSTITISSSGGGLSWNELTVVGPTAGVVDMGYVTNSGSRVQIDLPLTSTFGSVIEVVGKGSGGWQINQNAGQNILDLASTTTVGVTGTLTSSEPGATFRMVCITVDTTWRIVAATGNLIFT